MRLQDELDEAGKQRLPRSSLVDILRAPENRSGRFRRRAAGDPGVVKRRVLPSRPGELHPEHRVTGGGRPPPVPTERSVQISRTTLFRR